MNAWVVSAGSRQNIMIGRGVGDLLADVDHGAVNAGPRRSVHKTVNERRVGVLINLLNPAG